MLFGPQPTDEIRLSSSSGEREGRLDRYRPVDESRASFSSPGTPVSEVEREPLPTRRSWTEKRSPQELKQKARPRPHLVVKLRSGDRPTWQGTSTSTSAGIGEEPAVVQDPGRRGSSSSESSVELSMVAGERLQQSSSFRSSKAQLAPPSVPTASSTSFPSPKAVPSMPSQPRRSRSISPVQPQKSRRSQPRSRPSSSVITRTVPPLMRTGSPSQVAENLGPASTMYPGVWQALGFRHKDSVLNPEDISSPICVTGVNRFAAAWVVSELLSKGYKVRGTVESRADEISGLVNLPQAASHLELVECNLLTPESCDIAVAGCQYVIYTGLPSSCAIRDPLSELTEPGVHSVSSRLHVILPMMTNFVQACARAKVKKMLLLSSVAAMVDQISGASIVAEEAWNMESSAERNPHFLSFKMTEEICRRLIQQLPLEARFKFVSVNAGTLMGPELNFSGQLAPGNQVIYDLLSGKYSALVDLNWSMIDVRDCARVVVSALEREDGVRTEGKTTRGGRVVAVHRTLFLRDIVDILATNGFSGRDLPWRVGLPNWVARLPSYSLQLGQVGASLFPANSMPHGRTSPFKTDLAKALLESSFTEEKQTVLDVANSFIDFGLLKPWTDDSSAAVCAITGLPFTLFRRRHHCRECGRLVCDEVSRSRVHVQGLDERQRICDDCVRTSIPELLEMLQDSNPIQQHRAILAIRSLSESPPNHLLLARGGAFPLLLRSLHSEDETVTEGAAQTLYNLSQDHTSCIQLVLEGAVLELMECAEGTAAQRIATQTLRKIWAHIGTAEFRKMLLAVVRVSPQSSAGRMKGSVMITFVHLVDRREVNSLLPEGLISIMLQMLSMKELLPRRAVASAIRHLLPPRHNFDVQIAVPPFVVDNHEELLGNKALADIQFLVKGCITPINAHKVVLFVRNAYFKNMFGTSTAQMTTVEIEDCSYEVFSLLLRFLYTGQVVITHDVARELLLASSLYQVKELLVRCEKFLAGELTSDDVTDLLFLSIKCQANNLKKVCIAFLLQNIQEVVRTEGWERHREWAAKEVLEKLSEILGKEWEAAFAETMRDRGVLYRVLSLQDEI